MIFFNTMSIILNLMKLLLMFIGEKKLKKEKNCIRIFF
jgi:hypothetical protein